MFSSCYLVFLFFSVHQIFDVHGPIFAKICHTTRYVLKKFISHRDVRMCLLTNLRGKTLIFADFGTQNRPKSIL